MAGLEGPAAGLGPTLQGQSDATGDLTTKQSSSKIYIVNILTLISQNPENQYCITMIADLS